MSLIRAVCPDLRDQRIGRGRSRITTVMSPTFRLSPAIRWTFSVGLDAMST
jgi:hypothetical protein